MTDDDYRCTYPCTCGCPGCDPRGKTFDARLGRFTFNAVCALIGIVIVHRLLG